MELKVSVDVGLERLKILCSQEDGRRSEFQSLEVKKMDKRIGECVFSKTIQFNCEEVLGVRKSCISHK